MIGREKVRPTVLPRALPCGDSGVTIEFGDRIDENINDEVLALDRALGDVTIDGLIETVPTYRSLTIHYDPVVTSFEVITERALALVEGSQASPKRRRLLKIPVCYEGAFGVDLDEVAATLRLDREEVVVRHCGAKYRVFMLGFQPGFAYLGGLDPLLALPRRPAPRSGAKAGTISIAAGQCAVHAIDGPSGWHWIGRTPAETYQPGAASQFALEPGDIVTFIPFAAARWAELRAASRAGEPIIEIEATCHGCV